MPIVTKVIVLKYDEPHEGWLNKDNLYLVLSAGMPYTKFEVKDVTKEVTEIYRESVELNMLENAGVDNWQWYGEHLKDYDGNVTDLDTLELPW